MIEEKKIAKEEFFEFCEKLKPVYNYLVFVTAIDHPDLNSIEMVYHLRSLEKGDTLILKTDLPRENSEIHSVSLIWSAAEWHEREVFDLFGVKFIGHPDLRRILLPEDWEGHPLLKDYEKAGVLKRPVTL